MPPFPLRFSILLCPVAGAAAAAPAPPAHPAAAPAAHAHIEPVLLDQFVTSAAPFGRNQVDLAQATTVLSGRTLLLKQQPTIGETLAAETGISASSFGPGASRPIIRGLGGDRIRLLENGVGTLDASVASPDHAVSVEPFLVERIEVVRGPASLLYGSTAVGGAVNVITHRIEDELPEARYRGAAEVRHGTSAREWSRGGFLDVVLHQAAKRAVVAHVDAFRRSAEDLRIPGYADSDRLREEETAHAAREGESPPVFIRGRLPNSALRSDGGAAGLSLVGEAFHLGASYSGVNSNYGVPGHGHADAADGTSAGTRIDLRQRRTDLQGEWRVERPLINAVRLKAGHADYRHAELEPDGSVGTLFTNRGYDARTELLHGGKNSPWSGAVGLQLTRSKFGAHGEEAFVPSSLTRSGAIFTFQEIVRKQVTWQFGARLERTRIEAGERGGRSSTEAGGSVGAIWRIDDAHSLALSVAHTGRAPNAQELFAHGPHAGTAAFEIGDSSLRPERSLGAELSLRRRAGLVTGVVTVFANQFDGYIFEQPTGLSASEVDGEWQLLTGDSPPESEDALPVYRFVQRRARFHGAEVETLWHLHEGAGSQLDLKLGADWTRGRQRSANLPRIPAARLNAGAAWNRGPWSAAIDAQFVLRQRRTAPGENASGSYTLVSADAAYAFGAGHAQWQLFARGSNLAGAEARPHTSFVKDLAPLSDRSLTAGVRVRF